MKKYFEYALLAGCLFLMAAACTSDKKSEAANAPLQSTEETPPVEKIPKRPRKGLRKLIFLK